MSRVLPFLRAAGLFLARAFGAKIVDARTGRCLGRALVIPWGGRVHVVGLREPVMVSFATQCRLTYWKQEIAFSTRPAPDFPHEATPRS